MITFESRRQVLETARVKGAYFPNPGFSTVCQFRMVFGFPRPGCISQGLALAAEFYLPLGQFCEERASTTFAYKFVDIGNQVNGQNDMGPSIGRFGRGLGHTHSVT